MLKLPLFGSAGFFFFPKKEKVDKKKSLPGELLAPPNPLRLQANRRNGYSLVGEKAGITFIGTDFLIDSHVSKLKALR